MVRRWRLIGYFPTLYYHPHAPYNDSRKKHAARPSLSAVHDVDCLKTLNLPNANQGTSSGLTECPGIPRDLFNQWSCRTAADAKPPAAVDTPRGWQACVCVCVCVYVLLGLRRPTVRTVGLIHATAVGAAVEALVAGGFRHREAAGAGQVRERVLGA